MTTRTIAAFIASVVFAAILYLMGAFVAADFNVTTWTTEGRAWLAAIWFAQAIIIIAVETRIK